MILPKGPQRRRGKEQGEQRHHAAVRERTAEQPPIPYTEFRADPSEPRAEHINQKNTALPLSFMQIHAKRF